MLTPAELAALPRSAESIAFELQNWTVERIAQIIAKNGYLTATGKHLLNRLQELRAFDVDYQAQIAKMTGKTQTEIERIIWDAAEISYGYDKAIFTRRGIPFVPFAENVFMQELTQSAINLAHSEMGSITQTRGFMVTGADGKLHATETSQFLDSELDRVTLNITAGTQTYTDAIRQTVITMKNSGLRNIDYEGGISNRVDVAVRRAIMGGITNIMLEQSKQHAQQLGVTTFELSWHSAHRPSHDWGGRRYSTVPTDKIDIQTGRPFLTAEQTWEKYGGGVLGDPNEKHLNYPIDEFEPPLYTDSELKQKEADEKKQTEYRGKKYTPYDATQRMRDLERHMRALRLQGAGYKAQYQELRKHMTAKEIDDLDTDPYTHVRVRYQTAKQEYMRFTKAMGMLPQMERVYYDRLGRIF